MEGTEGVGGAAISARRIQEETTSHSYEHLASSLITSSEARNETKASEPDQHHSRGLHEIWTDCWIGD